MSPAPTVHGTAVLVGTVGVLIRGPSGSGKSQLAATLVERSRSGGPPAVLVADDRVELSVAGGRLIGRCPVTIAGLMEHRGRGIATCGHEPAAVIRLVADLLPPGDIARMPEESALSVTLEGVRIARQPVPAGDAAASARLVEAAVAGLGG